MWGWQGEVALVTVLHQREGALAGACSLLGSLLCESGLWSAPLQRRVAGGDFPKVTLGGKAWT